jgi:hypothetical protein
MPTLKYRVGNELLSVDSFDVPEEGDIYSYTVVGGPTRYNEHIRYNAPIKYNGGFDFSPGRDKLLALLNRS